MTAIVWFRRELRLHDNPALWAACEQHEHVLAVFCLERRLLRGPNRSLPRTRFMLGCLAELAHELADAGSRLFVLGDGSPSQVALPELAAACGAEVVLAAADVGPFARRRDRAVAEALTAAGRRLELLPGGFVVDDLATLRTGRGDPYTVFTPFHHRWLAAPRREPLPAPKSVPAPPDGLPHHPLPELDSLIDCSLPDITILGAGACWAPGERAARAAAERFLADGARHYASTHDLLAEPAGTSRLSPYLHLGCLSARELESQLGVAEVRGDAEDRDEGEDRGEDRGREGGGGEGPRALARQLCWRDFYAHVMLTHPGNAHAEHQPRYRRRIRWSRSRRRFDAWCDGRTGYPAYREWPERMLALPSAPALCVWGSRHAGARGRHGVTPIRPWGGGSVGHGSAGPLPPVAPAGVPVLAAGGPQAFGSRVVPGVLALSGPTCRETSSPPAWYVIVAACCSIVATMPSSAVSGVVVPSVLWTVALLASAGSTATISGAL